MLIGMSESNEIKEIYNKIKEKYNKILSEHLQDMTIILSERILKIR